MQKPLVSIIVPVYNVEKYIERCFNSIVSQTYENIECIFIDDCSPDNSLKILEGLIEKKERFSIIKHSQNEGLSAARNSGIKQAEGDYIFFLDSDDEITPNCVENLIEILREFPESEVIQGNIRQIPLVRNDWHDISKMKFPKNCDNQPKIKKMFFTFPRISITAWGKLISKVFLIKHELFFKEKIVNEDEEWSFRLAKCVKNISFTEKLCYLHYTNPNSIMNTGDLSKVINSRLIIYDDMLNNLDNEIIVMQIKFVDSLMQNVLCDIKSGKKYKNYMKIYEEVYQKLRLLKKKYPYACFPNKLYVRMKIKQIFGSKLSNFVRMILHKKI